MPPSAGRPGPRYWQLQTDFTIEARLDRATHTIFGKETIVVHNESPSELRQLVLRLDHNIFRADAQRGPSVPAETTGGMVVTALAVDGQAAVGAADAAVRACAASIEPSRRFHCRTASRRGRRARCRSSGTRSCPAVRPVAVTA